jgi:peptide/nickel transport system substrate-binding protein
VSADPKRGGILTAVLPQDPGGGWDIMRITIRFPLHMGISPLMSEGNMVRPCREDVFQVCPGLAESWESNSDFTQWTFKIRNNVKWHDGTLFTAEDAKFWLELIAFGAEGGGKKRAPAWFKAEFGDIKKIETLEGNRLRITLGQRAPAYLETISLFFWNITMPRHLAKPRIERGEVDVSPQDLGFVATGPFKFLEYEKGIRHQVRRFDGYWEKDEKGRQLPFMDGIDFVIMRDPSAMDAAFRVGRLDAGARFPGYILTKERKAAYERDLGDRVYFGEIASGGGLGLGLGFNVLKPGPLQDVRVRRAISLWVDKQASIDAYQGGFGYVAPILSPWNRFSSPDFLTWPGVNPATRAADRAEAKRLLAEAGYAKGLELTYNCQRGWLDRCVFFQGQLKELGIDLKFPVLDPAAWSASALTLDYDIFQTAAGFSTVPEAHESSLSRYSISKVSQAKHEDTKVSEAFQRMNTAASLDERVKLWRELERYMFLEKVYFLPISGNFAVVPYRSHLKGLPIPKEGQMANLEFATAWLDK